MESEIIKPKTHAENPDGLGFDEIEECLKSCSTQFIPEEEFVPYCTFFALVTKFIDGNSTKEHIESDYGYAMPLGVAMMDEQRMHRTFHNDGNIRALRRWFDKKESEGQKVIEFNVIFPLKNNNKPQLKK